MSTYSTTAARTGVRRGEISGNPPVPTLQFSAPPEFKGSPNTWTPEHFFTAGLATCFVTTFEAIAEFSKFAFEDLTVTTDGVLEKAEGGFRFTKVFVRPLLTIANGADQERAIRLLEKAEKACLISRSVSSDIILEPQVRVV